MKYNIMNALVDLAEVSKPYLIATLASSHSQIRKYSVMALGEIGAKYGSKIPDEMLFYLLANDPDFEVRCEAALTLEKLGFLSLFPEEMKTSSLDLTYHRKFKLIVNSSLLFENFIKNLTLNKLILLVAHQWMPTWDLHWDDRDKKELLASKLAELGEPAIKFLIDALPLDTYAKWRYHPAQDFLLLLSANKDGRFAVWRFFNKCAMISEPLYEKSDRVRILRKKRDELIMDTSFRIFKRYIVPEGMTELAITFLSSQKRHKAGSFNAYSESEWQERDEAALEVLVNIGKPVVDYLLTDLENKWVDSFRMKVLHQIGDPRAVPFYIKALGIKRQRGYSSRYSYPYETQALRGLVEAGSQAVDDLLAELHKKDSAVKSTVIISILGRIRDPKATPDLLNIFENGDLQEKAAAAEALGKIDDERIIIALLQTIQAEDKDVDIKESAIKVLWEKDDERIIDVLINILENENEDTQVYKLAIEILGKKGHKKATALILRFLSSENEQLRNASVLALGDMKDQTACQPLHNIINDKKEDNAFRNWAVINLIRIINTTEDNHILLFLLDSHNRDVRVKTINRLAAIGDSAVVKKLASMRKGLIRSRQEKRAGREALAAIRGRVGIDIWMKIMPEKPHTWKYIIAASIVLSAAIALGTFIAVRRLHSKVEIEKANSMQDTPPQL